MKTKLIGLITSIALLGSGAALAGGDWKKHDKQQQTQTQSQGSTDSTGGSGQVITTEGSAQGGSGTLGQGSSAQQGSTQQGSTQQLGSNELIGRVVKSSKKMVWVEHAGAIVPLKIDKQTRFNDPNLKRAQDFKEGDQVRASFEVREIDNVATSIQKSDSNLGTGSGTGGSGTGMGSDIGGDSDVLTPDTTRDPNSLPPAHLDDVMGGSGGGGTDSIEPPDVDKEGNSSNLGSDSTKGQGDY